MKRDWSGFKWDNNGGYSEVLCQSKESGMWVFIHYVNGVGIGGGAVGASYLEAIEMSEHFNTEHTEKPADATE